MNSKTVRIIVTSTGTNFGATARVVEVGKRKALYVTDVMASRNVAYQFAQAHAEARGWTVAS